MYNVWFKANSLLFSPTYKLTMVTKLDPMTASKVKRRALFFSMEASDILVYCVKIWAL